jgi:hypothetical protein
MSGGGGSSTNTVQNADPWSGQQPYLQYGFQQAQNNYQTPPEFYPGATYTPFSNQTEQAMGMAQNRALSGSPVENAMQGYVTNTLNNTPGSGTQGYLQGLMNNGNSQLNKTAAGGYLGSNPYLDGVYKNAASRVTETFNDQVMPGINASFGRAGGSGSQIRGEIATDAAGELSQTLGQMASNIYGNDYANERNRMLQAGGMQSQLGLGAANAQNQLLNTQGGIQRGAAALAPTAAGFDWQNIGQLANVGGQVEGKANQVLQDDMARWNYAQNLPDQQLANYITAIQGNYGGSTQTSQSGGSGSTAAGALGAGMLGYAGMSAAAPALGGMGAAGWMTNPWLGAAMAAGTYLMS